MRLQPKRDKHGSPVYVGPGQRFSAGQWRLWSYASPLARAGDTGRAPSMTTGAKRWSSQGRQCLLPGGGTKRTDAIPSELREG
jgi:hypothetical protein